MCGTLIESRELAGGADLKRVFVTSILEWMNAGWSIGEFSSASATFFANRLLERRMVSVAASDPSEVPVYGGAHLGGCAACDD
jgi:hypothetical protein